METTIYPNKKAPNLFKSNFLNKLTWSNPVLIFTMYSILSTGAIYYAVSTYNYSTLALVKWFAIGLFSWTFAEYILHRFLYHKIKDASYNSGFQYMFHGIHHSYPNDKSKVILPPVPSLIIAGILFSLFYLMMGHTAFVFTPGFMIGYALYMWIHYAVHKYPSPKKFNFWWAHHNIHHFQQHDRAFGVSTSIWDHVFGTMPTPKRSTITIKVDKDTKRV